MLVEVKDIPADPKALLSVGRSRNLLKRGSAFMGTGSNGPEELVRSLPALLGIIRELLAYIRQARGQPQSETTLTTRKRPKRLGRHCRA